MANLMPLPKMRFTNAGRPLVGGKVFFYVAGTTTPKTTFKDRTQATANTNPVILDSNGEADIWLEMGYYKVVLKTSTDVVVWTVDGVAADANGLNIDDLNQAVTASQAAAGEAAEFADAAEASASRVDLGALDQAVDDAQAAAAIAVGAVSGSVNTFFAPTKPATIALAATLADGATIICESDASFTPAGIKVRYTVASGLATSPVAEDASGVRFTPFGTGAVASTVEKALRSPTSGIGDVGLDNTLHIWCGDSTTELMGSNNSAADVFATYRAVGGPLEKIAGTINFGGSGFTLDGFVNDAAIPGFVGPSLGASAGAGNWDSWFHKPTGAISLATALAWRTGYASYKTIWTICYGINDLILYASTGNLTRPQIVDYLVPRLRAAINKIQAAYPQDVIVLRIPNPMTYLPYNAGFPNSTAYPTFDTDPAATSQALVEKWNQALRDTYKTVQGEFSRCVLMDVWDGIFGKSNTTLAASTQQPYLGDRVHPSLVGYAKIAVLYTSIIAPKYNNVPPRRDEADARAVTLSNSPWDNWPPYVVDNPKYKLVYETSLVGAGVNFLDIAGSLANWQARVSGPVYVYVEGVVTQYFATYSATAIAANTRLLGVAPNASLQAAPAALKVSIYQDNQSVVMLANDAYVNTQAATAKEAFVGTMNTSGNGFLRISFPGVNGRLSTKFIAGVLNGKLAVGGTIGQVIDFTAGGWTALSVGAAVNRQLQFNKAGVDYTTWTGQPAALFFSDDVPSPKSYEDLVISGTTDASAGTQSTHAHGLGYVPKRITLLTKGAGTVYQSAAPDATNIYLKATANSIAFDAYVL